MIDWTVADSSRLYGLELWGQPYFTTNDHGHVLVKPRGDSGDSLDLVDIVEGLQRRDLPPPLLIRFDDILEDRLEKLHSAFEQAIVRYNYNGLYKGVFPIKCNQHRHVVEQLVKSGRRWHFGLEAGSKAELLIALSLVEDPQTLLICNGYKDQRYIETTILARQLGRKLVVVIEQADEVPRIIEASRRLGAAPLLGVRAKLSARSVGRWSSSVGERAKFGLSMPSLLNTVDALQKANLLKDLQLLHFHVGSQISDIAVLKHALQEAGQLYVQLAALGAPMGYLDVGGGLGVDYDGSRSASAASANYSLQNYANDIVATVRECCEPHRLKVPTLVTESGRAIASHFSVLVFSILGCGKVTNQLCKLVPRKDEPLIVRNLRETLAGIDASNLQEAWNDAVKFKEDALSAFRLGYLDLRDRALAEELYWNCCTTIAKQLPVKDVPEDLQSLQASLAGIYYANFSVFRSVPDTWAINQLFPVMPIHRLSECPDRLGSFADLTCDSDGKLSQFIANGSVKPFLELHRFRDGEPYWIGLFLGGAYQEVMGNLHNLFGSTNAVTIRLKPGGDYQIEHVVRGDTNADVLEAMEHKPQVLLERLRHSSEQAVQSGNLSIMDAQRLIRHIENSLRQTTYLQN